MKILKIKHNYCYGAIFIATLSLVSLITLTGIVINTGISNVSAANRTVSTNVSVNVASSCTMVGDSTGHEHTRTVSNGTYETNIGLTTITAYCNDANGLMIYAIGSSNNIEGNNNMISTSDSSIYFPSGTATSGNTSNWAMKLSKATSDYPMTTIVSPYGDYATVPTTYTPVAYRTSATDVPSESVSASGSKITTTYAAFISSTQTAATYQGKVKYTLYHPYSSTDLTTLEDALYAADVDTMEGEDGEEHYVMQGLTQAVCNAASVAAGTPGSFVKVADSRDGSVYLVGKLADGKCWMLDNLRLDPTDSTIASNMSESNTHASTAAITNYFNNDVPSTEGWSTPAVANVTTDFNSYVEPRINNVSKNTLVTSYGPASTGGKAKVGIYYNYCAATVGTYCYDSGAAPAGVNASYDICPANWRMPTGGGSGEYQSLCTTVWGSTCSNGMSMTATDANSLQTKLSTPLSGRYYGSQAYDQGSNGYFWSSTRYDGNYMYRLSVRSSNVYPQDNGGRYYGFSVRCVAGS